jgi:hypothetical protein
MKRSVSAESVFGRACVAVVFVLATISTVGRGVAFIGFAVLLFFLLAPLWVKSRIVRSRVMFWSIFWPRRLPIERVVVVRSMRIPIGHSKRVIMAALIDLENGRKYRIRSAMFEEESDLIVACVAPLARLSSRPSPALVLPEGATWDGDCCVAEVLCFGTPPPLGHKLHVRLSPGFLRSFRAVCELEVRDLKAIDIQQCRYLVTLSGARRRLRAWEILT